MLSQGFRYSQIAPGAHHVSSKRDCGSVGLYAFSPGLSTWLRTLLAAGLNDKSPAAYIA